MTPHLPSTVESAALNLLLVEDDEVDVMNIQRAFRKCEMRPPLVAGDGAEAMDVLKGRSDKRLPTTRRIILLDLNLPKVTGLEFLRRLRADPDLRGTPVVILTTSESDRDKVEAFSLNVAGYLLKPVSPEELTGMVADLTHYWHRNQFPSDGTAAARG